MNLHERKQKQGIAGQSTYYTTLPWRKIVCRYVEIDFNLPEHLRYQYPVMMAEYECGHRDFDRGQKERVRCPFCAEEGRE